jgi:hypothetical protein
LEDGDQEDYSLKTVQAKNLARPHLTSKPDVVVHFCNPIEAIDRKAEVRQKM